MQTTHNVFPQKGLPGELYDMKSGNDIISCIANENLQPGRFVELASSDVATDIPLVQQCQGATNATMTVVGVVVRDTQHEQNNWPANTDQGYLAGSRIAVLRRGRIYAERDTADTGAPTRFQAHNVMHSSTTAAKRGMVTLAATTTSVGVEVSASTVSQFWQDSAADFSGASNASVALIEVYVK